MIRQSELISKDYLESQKWMHAQPRGYGGRGDHWAPTVIHVAKQYDCMSVLEYGAGQGRLGIALRAAGFVCRDYDPAIPGWDAPPAFADLVTCCDVMEHVEPDKIDNVFAHIKMLARKAAFLVIACRPANKLLPNGHNAHLTIQPKQYWRERILSAGFTIDPAPTVLPDKMPGKCWMGVVRP